MEYIDYLKERYSDSTAARYGREIAAFLNSGTPITHGGITAYLGGMREGGKDPRVCLCAIKAYCSYLLSGEYREDDPSAAVRLIDSRTKDVQLQDLFTTGELEGLLEKPCRYAKLKTRNRCALEMLIYQALTLGEITTLKTDSVDLTKGTVSIGGKAPRTLKLRPQQAHSITLYLHIEREKLKKTETDALLLTMQGNPEKGEGIRRMLERLDRGFPDRRLNATTIRQSVIANLLKNGADLRLVQVFAGHRWPRSTERYRRRGLEELKKAVSIYHPLG